MANCSDSWENKLIFLLDDILKTFPVFINIEINQHIDNIIKWLFIAYSNTNEKYDSFQEIIRNRLILI